MYIKIFEDNPNSRDILKIVELLKNGGVMIYPTDTIYGIGCDINQVKAVQRVCQLKGINPNKANFSMICRDLSNIATYAKVNNEVFKVMKRNLPGPFTFILPATSKLPHVLMNKRRTIGIRVPNHHIIQAIVEELGNPILTTSVKADDEVIEYITDPELIYEKYRKQVDVVIDG
jgi:tRNA threonylcarbamoyl adenosine modification protein (Sua5/YciO/YrdC/YwlC family)